MNDTKKYLFLFTLGPVQSFIAQARKTQDLYAGSQILSELVSEGINIFQQKKGIVIFPNPTNNSKPNRFLGKIENSDDLQGLGEKVEKAVRDKFEDLAEEALKKAKKENNKPTGFDTQINNHLEIFWIFEEIINDDYKTAYQNIEQNLGAIKNIRPFAQMPETGRKCSLDGERNALFYKRTESGKVPNFINEKETTEIEEKDQDEVKVAKGEGLSAVSFLKRFYVPSTAQTHDLSRGFESRGLKSGGFPSTAEIALMHSLSKIDDAEFKKVFQKNGILKVLEQEGKVKVNGNEWESWNEQFYYEENLTTKQIPCEAQLKIAKDEHKKLKQAFKEANIKFDKYYALLVFDGDSMGKILSGQLLQNPNIDLAKYQNDLSKLLGEFAKKATEYLHKDKHNGHTVYAGGDDFLGFVNLHCLFKVLQDLRQSFEKEVNQELQKNYKLTQDFTFSAGIAIAHYKTPLDIVLKTAKAMEHEAKDLDPNNKNAFAISVLKHSGESHESVFKWGQKAENLTRIKEIVNALKKDFSDTWISNAQREFYVLQEDDHKIKTDLRPALHTELKRLLNRSCNLQGEEKKNRVNDINKKTKELVSSTNYDFQNFSEMLNICRFMNKELKTK